MTATASQEEQEGIKHHLLSYLPLNTFDYNVNKFSEKANEILDELANEGKNVIVVGGTNYYTESLIYGKRGTPEDKSSEEESLGIRTPFDFDVQVLQELLVKKDYNEMFEFYQKAEHEKSKLIQENDSRRLENAMKRLLNNKTSDYSWNVRGDRDFIMLILDTDNIEWIESRIKKRIREMVCEEGGLQEIFKVLLSLSKFWAESDAKPLEEAILGLESKTNKGVLQAIGYKEFIHLFQEVYKSTTDGLAGEDLEQEMVERGMGYLKGYDEEGNLLKISVDNLAKDTIRLTKRQRKWIKNRILTNEYLVDRSFYFKVESKPQFFDHVLPNALNISKEFLKEDHENVEDLNKLFSNFKHKLLKKNRKIDFHCDICDKKIVGEKEKMSHLSSRKHRKRKSKLNKKKLKQEMIEKAKEEE